MVLGNRHWSRCERGHIMVGWCGLRDVRAGVGIMGWDWGWARLVEKEINRGKKQRNKCFGLLKTTLYW